MVTIQIDDQVFAELSHRATGFHVTPNDVLRRVLNLGPLDASPPPDSPQRSNPIQLEATLTEFLTSEQFQRHHQTIDRFLAILSWLHSAEPKAFGEVAKGFRRGKRLYFALSEQEILQSGEGITVKPIPKSPFWALTTLDNKSKRIVIEDVLSALRYSPGDINLVLAKLPDTGIRRSHGRMQLLEGM